MAVYRRGTRRRWPSRHEPENGFTLVEVMVALGVIFTTLLLLAFTLLSAFKSIGFSRQRTEATSLANQALEQIRALPADQLLLSGADPVTPPDPLLLPSGCLTTAAATCTFQGRVVPKANFGPGPATTPLVPTHMAPKTASPGVTNYMVGSYITLDPTDSQTRIATILVTWDHAQQTGVPATVQVESKLHTAPFTALAPNLKTYNSTAQTTAGQISVTGVMLDQTGVQLSLPLPTTNAFLNGGIGGTNVGGSTPGQQVLAGTASGGLKSDEAAAIATPGASTPSRISLAPSTGVDGPGPVSATPGLPLSLPGSLPLQTGTLTGQIAAGAVTQADAVAASRANNQPGILGETLPGNKLGYGSAQATQSGLVSTNLNLVGLLNIPLVEVTPGGNSAPDRSTVVQTGTLAGPSQTFTAAANKSFSEVDVLPTLGIVKLSGFKASASACASPTAALCPPSTAISEGTLTVLGIATPITLLNHVAGSLGLHNTTVDIGLAHLVVGATATIGSTTSTSPGSGQVISPLTIHVTLQISTLGVPLVNLVIDVDLGNITTTANYS